MPQGLMLAKHNDLDLIEVVKLGGYFVFMNY